MSYIAVPIYVALMLIALCLGFIMDYLKEIIEELKKINKTKV